MWLLWFVFPKTNWEKNGFLIMNGSCKKGGYVPILDHILANNSFSEEYSTNKKINKVAIPIPSMYGIFTYIYHILPLETTKHVGKYAIHGWYGIANGRASML